MIAYVGQTRSAKLQAELTELGIREITQPDEFPPRRKPWAFDNGAFKQWRAGAEFASCEYLETAYLASLESPDFVVVPDVVAGGTKSLDLSLGWVDRLKAIGPLYLVTQDGMDAVDIAEYLPLFSGLFVGGTLEWKLRTSPDWVKLAHKHGKRCHIGRVGTGKRVRWAKRIGADSIDSCVPLFSRDNLARFVAALNDTQEELRWDTR